MPPKHSSNSHLSPEEKKAASGIWTQLMNSNSLDREAWLATSENVRKAIVTEMTIYYKIALEMRSELELWNPFEDDEHMDEHM